jgi:hypothetical protein
MSATQTNSNATRTGAEAKHAKSPFGVWLLLAGGCLAIDAIVVAQLIRFAGVVVPVLIGVFAMLLSVGLYHFGGLVKHQVVIPHLHTPKRLRTNGGRTLGLIIPSYGAASRTS